MEYALYETCSGPCLTTGFGIISAETLVLQPVLIHAVIADFYSTILNIPHIKNQRDAT
jgi:hypothetical protein